MRDQPAFLDSLRTQVPNDRSRLDRVSLIEDGTDRKVRMANLAIVGSHSTNGVSAIHSTLLRTRVVPDLAGIFPTRFNNKTNGVTPRRWLQLCNPGLTQLITDAIGDGWITDLSQLARLKPLAGDKGFRSSFRKAKREAKMRFVDWVEATTGEVVDPTRSSTARSNAFTNISGNCSMRLHIVVLYNRLRENPHLEFAPRAFFFAGKAAPAYALAKLIIKFINNLAGTIKGDPAVGRHLRVVFVPDYCVSVAERLIPASDVSNRSRRPAMKPAGRAT